MNNNLASRINQLNGTNVSELQDNAASNNNNNNNNQSNNNNASRANNARNPAGSQSASQPDPSKHGAAVPDKGQADNKASVLQGISQAAKDKEKKRH